MKFSRLAFVFAAFFGFAASLGAQDGKLIFALKPNKNPEEMMQEKGGLEQYLFKRLNVPVEAMVPLSSSAILEGFANGTIDAGFLSATDLIIVRERGLGDLLLVNEINGKTHYKSYWIALKEKPYDSVEDLRGKPVAFSSRTSTSGYVIPMWDLHQKGLIGEDADAEAFFGRNNVFHGTGYVSAAKRVLEGDAEAAALSYYVLDEDKHLSREERGRLKKVAEQGPVPTHVVVVRQGLSEERTQALKEALLGLNEAGQTELRDQIFGDKLVETNPEEHVKSLQAALDYVKNAN